MTSNHTRPSLLYRQIRLLLFVAGVLIALEVVNIFTANYLNQFGVLPRHWSHIGYIFTAPWLHGSITHLVSNLLPLLIFMWLTMQWGMKRFYIVSLFICVFAGLSVWLFARTAFHIGASGMVYGYFGFLVWAGFRARNFRHLLISLVVIVLYGGMIFGVLPTQPYISFEYHLFGFVGGLIAAHAWGKWRDPL